MGQIKVEKNVGGIEGLCVIEPEGHLDARGYFMERGRAFSPDGHRLSERISGEFYGKPGEDSGFLFLFYIFLNLLTASVLYIAGAPNKREGGAGGWKKQSW